MRAMFLDLDRNPDKIQGAYDKMMHDWEEQIRTQQQNRQKKRAM